ncbi:hypothetical protein E2562_019842 [Oryza meyeriana var. granulata]|uniref:Uncharacterized protein n=1 Tax=Oryza meyeriana var. granulata TaxID=110450 RepID=A0A6G1CTI7_9ORYZ|nr:hypothetical protein E2562_019842 [Oryza meyeriana var. granulata]
MARWPSIRWRDGLQTAAARASRHLAAGAAAVASTGVTLCPGHRRALPASAQGAVELHLSGWPVE